MRKFKQWLINKFLPAWAKETLLTENQQQAKEIRELREKINMLNAYIDGLEGGIRAQRRIVINTSEVKK